MLKNLVPIVAATLLVLFVLVSVVPMLHLFETDEEIDEAEAAALKWRSHGIESYEFVVTKSCVCAPPGNIPVKVVVRDYLTIAAYDSRIEFDAGRDRIEGIPHSVPDLLALANATTHDQGVKIEAKFNDLHGYPEVISIDPNIMAEDDEIVYRIEQFHIEENAVR